jgi:hypothetical protein
MILIILCVSAGHRTEKEPSIICLALLFTVLLGLSGHPYLGQPSAFTSLSGSGLTFFTAGGIAWLFLGTR